MLAMLRTLTVGLALGFAASAIAGETRHGDLVIQEPWARATPAAASVGAGYVTITNEGLEPDRLISGEAAFAGRVEVHEMAMVDGVMRMRPLASGIELAPGETVTLEPGGLHLMFQQLREPLLEGETHAATLVFERAGRVEVEVEVRSMAAGGHRHAH